jgi:CheY-like chemotaxis protein
VNKGSHFSVRVPLASRREISPPMSAKPGLLPAFQGRVVCIVDDDALVLGATSQLLRGWGCTAVTFLSTSEALSHLKQHGLMPDLIIADINLSGGDTGVAAIEAVRLQFGADVPAFLISADAEPGRMVDLRAMGYRLLHKPLSPLMLRAAMLSVFK